MNDLILLIWALLIFAVVIFIIVSIIRAVFKIDSFHKIQKEQLDLLRAINTELRQGRTGGGDFMN